MFPKAKSSPLRIGGKGRGSFPFEWGELLVLEMVSAAFLIFASSGCHPNMARQM